MRLFLTNPAHRARQFPSLVPTFPKDGAFPAGRQTSKAHEALNKPAFTSFNDNDPMTAGVSRRFYTSLKCDQDQAQITIPGAGNFLPKLPLNRCSKPPSTSARSIRLTRSAPSNGRT